VDKFMESTGVESGYFAKRKDQFNNELLKGIKSATGQPATVKTKKKFTTNPKKGAKLTEGQEWYKKMQEAKKSKAEKESQKNEKDTV